MEIKVGDKLTSPFWGKKTFVEVLSIGKNKFMSRDQTGDEEIWPINPFEPWLPYEEPKKLLAPAIWKNNKNDLYITNGLFDSKDKAIKLLLSRN